MRGEHMTPTELCKAIMQLHGWLPDETWTKVSAEHPIGTRLATLYSFKYARPTEYAKPVLVKFYTALDEAREATLNLHAGLTGGGE